LKWRSHALFSACFQSGLHAIFQPRSMAIVKPFAALRPDPALAARLCELPYDVYSSEEAREMASGNPLSFLHVSKPEIDLPGVEPQDERVYALGRATFLKLISEGALTQDRRSCFYLYRQVMGAHRQLGLVALASCQEYLEGAIKKHELTRPEKEDDRARHIEALDAQTGPAFLTYPAVASLDQWLEQQTQAPPDIDFVARDGVRHSSWPVSDQASQESIIEQFGAITALYVADGHHRSAAAARVFQARRGAGGSAYLLSVIFPHNQLRILPYHRTLRDLNGLTAEQVLRKLERVFFVTGNGLAEPLQRHDLGLYLNRRWFTLTFRPEFVSGTGLMEKLDATLLQKHVLKPIFGIIDSRTSDRIGFVGGIRGAGELERLVNQGEAACAFSMYPTSIEDLMAIASQGKLMPPKSTWFEPKLRDGMFCHLL
jgi:uncharacterized protein (DUF1015 family)